LSEVVINQAQKPRAIEAEAEANHHQTPDSSRQDPQVPSYQEQAQDPTMHLENHWHQQTYHRGIPDPPPWSDPQQEEEEQHEKINFVQEAVDTMHEEMNSREANMNAMDAKLNRITIMVQQLIERAQNQPYQYHPFNPPLSQQYQPNPTMFEQQREPPQEMMPLQQLTTLQMPPTEYQDISTPESDYSSPHWHTVTTVIDDVSIIPEDDDAEDLHISSLKEDSTMISFTTDSTFSVPENPTSRNLATMKPDSPLTNSVSTETMKLVLDHFSTVRPPETTPTNEQANPFAMMQAADYFHRSRPPEMRVAFVKTWFEPFAILDYFSRTRPPELI
jgi:hypothetical protein